MNPIASRLTKTPFLILDGALATMLEHQGADLNDPLWSGRALLETPHQVEDVHRLYAHAGADILTTATYQITTAGLENRGWEVPEQARVFVDAAACARRASSGVAVPPLVAGSVGSWGAYLADGSEYRGRYGLGRAALADFHRPRLRLLAEHCDLIAAETIPSLDEALAIVDVLEELGSPPAWISFSLRDATHNAEGHPLRDCARVLEGLAPVVALGVNCCAPGMVEEATWQLARETALPLVVYPNSGEHWAGSWSGPPWSPLRWAKAAQRWWQAGARIIGGCCRTTPEHIAALHDLRANLIHADPKGWSSTKR